jgi:hypothetical protein
MRDDEDNCMGVAIQMRRLVGGYEWQATAENARILCLEILAHEENKATRRKLRRVFDLLRWLGQMQPWQPTPKGVPRGAHKLEHAGWRAAVDDAHELLLDLVVDETDGDVRQMMRRLSELLFELRQAKDRPGQKEK